MDIGDSHDFDFLHQKVIGIPAPHLALPAQGFGRK
jgi:hypothetical protein